MTVGELADRPVGVVGSDLGGEQTVIDEGAQERHPLQRPGTVERDGTVLDHRHAVRGEQGEQTIRRRLAGAGTSRQHDRRVHPTVSDRTRRGGEVRPRARHVEPGVGQHVAPEPQPGDVGFRLHGDHVSVERVTGDQRLEEVAAVLRIDPTRRKLVERPEKPGGGKLADAHGIDHRHVRAPTLGDGANEDLMEILEVDDGDVEADLAVGGGTQHRRPRPLGHDQAQLRERGVGAQPVRIDVRPAPTVAQDHPFLGKLGEGAMHRRAADPVLRAQVVLGRQLLVHVVATGDDLLEEDRLQLLVDRDRAAPIDRPHGVRPAPSRRAHGDHCARPRLSSARSAESAKFLRGGSTLADLHQTPRHLHARRVTITEDGRATRRLRGAMNQIERTMTAGDVIEFTMHDQRHTAVVMLMTDDDLVLLDLLDGDRPAWAGISSLQEAAIFTPESGEDLAAA